MQVKSPKKRRLSLTTTRFSPSSLQELKMKQQRHQGTHYLWKTDSLPDDHTGIYPRNEGEEHKEEEEEEVISKLVTQIKTNHLSPSFSFKQADNNEAVHQKQMKKKEKIEHCKTEKNKEIEKTETEKKKSRKRKQEPKTNKTKTNKKQKQEKLQKEKLKNTKETKEVGKQKTKAKEKKIENQENVKDNKQAIAKRKRNSAKTEDFKENVNNSKTPKGAKKRRIAKRRKNSEKRVDSQKNDSTPQLQNGENIQTVDKNKKDEDDTNNTSQTADNNNDNKAGNGINNTNTNKRSKSNNNSNNSNVLLVCSDEDETGVLSDAEVEFEIPGLGNLFSEGNEWEKNNYGGSMSYLDDLSSQIPEGELQPEIGTTMDQVEKIMKADLYGDNLLDSQVYSLPDSLQLHDPTVSENEPWAFQLSQTDYLGEDHDDDNSASD